MTEVEKQIRKPIMFKSGSTHMLKPSMSLAPWESRDKAKVRIKIFLEAVKERHKIADAEVTLTHDPTETVIECKMPQAKTPKNYKVFLDFPSMVIGSKVLETTSGVRIIPQ
ncbi:unnamed protein product [marine sediment metagenome]|uniref:Uncharacterized protein n=1 Tax=marine sediment metagenome TaxID=412755 RepID=X1UF06_9ZZZZ